MGEKSFGDHVARRRRRVSLAIPVAAGLWAALYGLMLLAAICAVLWVWMLATRFWEQARIKIHAGTAVPIGREVAVAVGQDSGSEKPRIWFYRARELTGPWLGVRGARPPVYFGGDEYGRSTVAFHLPGVGAMVVALSVGKKRSVQL